MQIERKKISDLNRAAYNPRIDLIPGDSEYESLRRSISTYGLLIPVIWNKRTNNVVGGHQRLTVLENEGETEVDVSVVDLNPIQERQLNVALNKIEGGWDEEKLGALLEELGDDATLTGFNQQEIDSLTNDIDSLIDESTVDEELQAIEELFNVSLTFDKADQDELKAYVKDYGKEALVETIIQKAKGRFDGLQMRDTGYIVQPPRALRHLQGMQPWVQILFCTKEAEHSKDTEKRDSRGPALVHRRKAGPGNGVV